MSRPVSRRIARRNSQPWRPMHLERLENRRLLAGGEFRSFDGTGNNEDEPDWGAAHTQLLRRASIAYEDGISEPAGGFDGAGRPNARAVSNAVFDQPASILNDRGLTSFIFQWGQFLDHDMDLTEEHLPIEDFSIPIPPGDPDAPPGTRFVPLLRSRFDTTTGTSSANPRQQINQITSYIDGSNVYGSESGRAAALRTGFGGLMLTSRGDADEGNTGADGSFLPFNYRVGGEFPHNAAPPPLEPHEYFLAGDIRANEQPGLTAMHTLFLREHNRQARRIAEDRYPGLDLASLTGARDEEIFQAARAWVGAEIQAITYYEFLPALLGPQHVPAYRGYDPLVNASIANIFSGALYRVGHTMLPPELLRLETDGQSIPEGPLALGSAFFQPSLITDFDIEPYLKGLAVQHIQEIDSQLVDGVRNLLFDPPAAIDLGAINLQRGRDHGLPDYRQVREDLGLPAVNTFDDISTHREVAEAIRAAYGNDLNKIDVFLGAVAEDHLPGSSVGPLIHDVLIDQFSRLRNGDRFYFESVFDGDQLSELLDTRLSDIIRRNTGLATVQDEVFRDPSVLVVRPPDNGQAVDLDIMVKGKKLKVVDGNTGQVLASEKLGHVTTLVLFGTDHDDRFKIHAKAMRSMTVPIELHAGGGQDTVIAEGTRGHDHFYAANRELRLNHALVHYGDVEVVHLQGRRGSDWLRASDDLAAALILDGGPGNDWLAGSAKSDILLGGRGNDTLFGRKGDDVLIGGRDRDRLRGQHGEDLLIAGTTLFDDNLAMLLTIGERWDANDPYADRVQSLRDVLRVGGPHPTVRQDRDPDSLHGGRMLDWYFLDPATDVLRGRQPGEFIN